MSAAARVWLRLMASRLGYLLACVNYWMLLAPLVATLVLGLLIYHSPVRSAQSVMEPLALAVLGASCAACLVRLAVSRHPFFLWATALAGVLLAREIHFAGTSAGVYLGLLLVAVGALHHFERLKDHLASKTLLTLLATGFVTYFFSQTLDLRWWRGFPGESVVHVPLEETLEVLGHGIIGGALAWSKPKTGACPSSGKVPQ